MIYDHYLFSAVSEWLSEYFSFGISYLGVFFRAFLRHAMLLMTRAPTVESKDDLMGKMCIAQMCMLGYGAVLQLHFDDSIDDAIVDIDLVQKKKKKKKKQGDAEGMIVTASNGTPAATFT